MNKRNRNHHTSAAPLMVLLNKRSLDSIKEGIKEDVPAVLSYTLEDFRKLGEMHEGMEYPKSDYLLRIWTFLRDNCTGHESMKDLYSAFDSKTRGKDFVLKRMFIFIFHTPLVKVPLKVNHMHFADIAKWRLSIHK